MNLLDIICLYRNASSPDFIPGGLGDNVSDDKFDKSELDKGIKSELEHTHNKELAKQIAKDHLMEIKDYYTRLENMENESKSKS